MRFSIKNSFRLIVDHVYLFGGPHNIFVLKVNKTKIKKGKLTFLYLYYW